MGPHSLQPDQYMSFVDHVYFIYLLVYLELDLTTSEILCNKFGNIETLANSDTNLISTTLAEKGSSKETKHKKTQAVVIKRLCNKLIGRKYASSFYAS